MEVLVMNDENIIINKKPQDKAAEADVEYVDFVPCGPSANEMMWQEEAGDCEAVLDVQDSLVSCVEGVNLQHFHELKSEKSVSLVDRVLPEGGPLLTSREASLIRLQNQQLNPPTNPISAATETLRDVDLLSIILCGSDSEDLEDHLCQGKPSLFPNCCETKRKDVEGSMLAEKLEILPHCEICLVDILPNSSNQVSLAKLPCCGKTEETGSLKICSACVILLTQRTSDSESRVGRCPRCRSWIVVRAPDGNALLNLDISTVAQSGMCASCNQFRSQLVDCGEVCDACFLGRCNPLLYECQQCHGAQRIPHPMYRYQASPGEFGTKTWSCEGPCNFLTHWRIRHDQLVHVPVGDASWSVEDWKVVARQRVQQARRELNVNEQNSDCCIL
ncbi:hypothetical protein ACA910_005884 [Epithemia clementina (nom. ined.)]